ncbi:MAG TPA: flagellar hook-basal body complex protein FliE [Vicinamibacterales bacterium]|nr:flagellar hook-basal body complex protein FliE [Vicinamibacterales bacterium]
MPIQSIGSGLASALSGQTPGAGGSGASSNGLSFGDSLGKLLADVKSSAGAANDAVGKMLDGSGDVHTAMIALQRADLTLQLTVQVRNKLVSAYQTIMQMGV